MAEDSCCAGGSCGCGADIFPTDRACPDCGKKLRLTGRAQTFQLRLNCPACGYNSAMLSSVEISEVL